MCTRFRHFKFIIAIDEELRLPKTNKKKTCAAARRKNRVHQNEGFEYATYQRQDTKEMKW